MSYLFSQTSAAMSFQQGLTKSGLVIRPIFDLYSVLPIWPPYWTPAAARLLATRYSAEWMLS